MGFGFVEYWILVLELHEFGIMVVEFKMVGILVYVVSILSVLAICELLTCSLVNL